MVFDCSNPPWPTEIFIYCFQNNGRVTPGLSTWPTCFGSSRHTSGMVGDVRQTGQAAGEFGQPAVGKELVDGGGFSHSSCGDHRHRPEQGAAAGADGAQDLTLWVATNRLLVEQTSYTCARQEMEGDQLTPVCRCPC